MKQSISAAPVNKKPFIIRWGNFILLFIALFFLVLGAGAELKSKSVGVSSGDERMFYGIIYLICVAGILVLSIIRIAKKHRRILSVLWIFVVLFLLYWSGIFFMKP